MSHTEAKEMRKNCRPGKGLKGFSEPKQTFGTLPLESMANKIDGNIFKKVLVLDFHRDKFQMANFVISSVKKVGGVEQ